MSFVVKDRIRETTTTTGTGTVTLAGAVSGYQSFSVIGNGNKTYYTIVSSTSWEVGIGTYTSSGTTLSRDTILASSNSGSAINLSGTSTVFCSYPADKSIYVTDEYDNGNSGTSKTVDWSNGRYQKITLTGNCTFTFTNGKVGLMQLKLIQDGTGGRTITLTGYYAINGIPPTPNGTASSVTLMTVYFDGTNYYCG